MKSLARLSLRWKLVLACVAVEAVMLGTLAWNGLRLNENSLTAQAEIRLRESSLLFNATLGPLLARQDYGPIADIFREIRGREGIQDLVLTDPAGRVLLTDGEPAGAALPVAEREGSPRTELPRFATRIPIHLAGQTYGYLSYGISPQFIAEAHQQLARQSVAIAGAALALSLFLLAGLGVWLTRHLRELERASEKVAQGNFDLELGLPDDEIGSLALAFNRMAGEIKRQIEALRASEGRFQSLLHLSTDWYWEQDADFRFTRHESGRANASRRGAQILGKRRWEMPNTLSEAEWAAHRAVLEAHETFHGLEYGVMCEDGSVHHFRVHGEPVFDADGRFVGYRGTSADITDRKRVEESLRLAASVFAEAQEGIIITDAQWRIVDCNPTVCEWTGYERGELIGRDLHEHFASTGDIDLIDSALEALARQGHWRGEARGRRKNGEFFPELLTASAVRDAAGKALNYSFIFSDITVLKDQQQRLEHLAHYDALTRLPNRVLLADRIQQALSLAQRSGEVVAVAYLDLDGFKPVNDALGHAAGDQLLIEVGARLRNSIRGGDTVARLGGDEFVLLIRAQDFGDCEAAMLRVLGVLSTPYNLDGKIIELTASIGITLYPHDGADPEVLLRHADQAMYAAKQAGRNRYHLFDSESDRRISAHRELFSRIEQALPANEFVLYYQPKVDMRQGRVIGAEALIRWRHPERGLLPPSEFLPVIEDTDFAIALGEWVIATALAQMQSWRALGLDLPVSVNISARQLQAGDFVDRLTAMLAVHPEVPAEWVELEILETAALDDIQYVSQVIHRCHELGVSFALDDFGTGYSSLTYFKRLPARLLKIDQSFIRDMLADPEDLAIVQGVIGLARAFERNVIAEGVETPEHGVRLMEMGCHLAQGFGIARPMPGEAIPEWIGNYRPDPRWGS